MIKTEDPYSVEDFSSYTDIENLFNLAIDVEAALENLDQERYVFAGVFTGRAAVEFVFSLISVYNTIAAGFAKEDTFGPSNGQISESQKEESDAAFLEDFWAENWINKVIAFAFDKSKRGSYKIKLWKKVFHSSNKIFY